MDERLEPALTEELAGVAPDEELEALALVREGHSLPAPARAIAAFGRIVTCRVPAGSAADVASSDAVEEFRASRNYTVAETRVEETGGAIRRSATRGRSAQGPTGAGVTVAFADFGCDVAHDNVRDEAGNTRVSLLWHQAATSDGNRYGYGRFYSRDDIDRALLTGEPYRALGYTPTGGSGRGAHGTHVMDIAVGNGRMENSLEGVAPGVDDIVFVHLAARRTPVLSDLGSSVRLLEAVDVVRRAAADRPWVCNLSLGRTGGDHSGNTLVERALDYVVEEAPGRAIVQSVGNYFNRNIHTDGWLRPHGTSVIEWVIQPGDRTPNELEVWYSGRDKIGVSLAGPNGSVADAPPDKVTEVVLEGAVVGRIYREPGSGDRDAHVDIYLLPTAEPGTWTLSLTGEDVLDGRYHAWVERDSTKPGAQSAFPASKSNPYYTTGTIANGYRTVAVGAYDDRNGELAGFSSAGPTRTGRVKPDLVAPGVRVLAARSGTVSSPPGLIRMSGTSMAAPHVTGAIALMFEAAPRPLRIDETRKMLLGTADELGLDPLRAGSGVLNVAAAVVAAQAVPNGLPTSHGGEIPASRPPTSAATLEPVGPDAASAPRDRGDGAAVEDPRPAQIDDSEQAEYVPDLGAPSRGRRGSTPEEIGSHDLDRVYRSNGVLRSRVAQVARALALDPGFLAANMHAEVSDARVWSRRRGDVASERLGLDDWFDPTVQRYLARVLRAHPGTGLAMADVRMTGDQWDVGTEKPGAGLKPRGTLPAEKAVAAIGAYLKASEAMLRRVLRNRGLGSGVLDSMTPEQRLTVLRLAFNGGVVPASRLAIRIVRGGDIERRGRTTRDPKNPGRTAALHMARAIHLSQAVFGRISVDYDPAASAATHRPEKQADEPKSMEAAGNGRHRIRDTGKPHQAREDAEGMEAPRGSAQASPHHPVVSPGHSLPIHATYAATAAPATPASESTVGTAPPVAAPIELMEAAPKAGQDIKFELELDYGLEPMDSHGEPVGAPFIAPSARLGEDTKVTTHSKSVHGFEVVMDGPRMEIESRRLDLVATPEFERVVRNILAFMTELEKRAAKAPQRTVATSSRRSDFAGRPMSITGGRPRFFPMPMSADPSFVAFPIKNLRRQSTWFRSGTHVHCAPQVTIDIPLEAVQSLVHEIRQSERGRRSVRLTGRRGARAGLRSDALYHANDAVLASFRRQVRVGAASPVELTRRLAGFMILLVSYLRTSEMAYHKPDRPGDPSFDTPERGSLDHERFPKAYTPLAVHTHFGELFRHALSPTERSLFLRLYGDTGARQTLFDLALDTPGAKDGKAELFPARTRGLQVEVFGRVLTWDELIESAIDPAAKLTSGGAEVLPTPLASASKGTAKAGPPGARVDGVRLELRRIGYKWWTPAQWRRLARFSYDMARDLNGVS